MSSPTVSTSQMERGRFANQGSSREVTVHEPTTVELERVLYLFGDATLRPAARFLALVRSKPIERFIAAAGWWPEGRVGQFQIACRPGVARAAIAPVLIEAVTSAARSGGMETLHFATLVTEEDEWFGCLREQGFEASHSERSFQVAYRDAWTRVMQLHGKHRSRIPPGWRTEPIRLHTPETILELVVPHRLLLPGQLNDYWRADAESGFDLELSCILFDGPRPFGTFLLRRLGDGLCIDLQVVQERSPRLRSLADLFMLYHSAQRLTPEGPIRWIWFRSGHTEHRQTANLALRMGGRELALRHSLSKKL